MRIIPILAGVVLGVFVALNLYFSHLVRKSDQLNEEAMRQAASQNPDIWANAQAVVYVLSADLLVRGRREKIREKIVCAPKMFGGSGNFLKGGHSSGLFMTLFRQGPASVALSEKHSLVLEADYTCPTGDFLRMLHEPIPPLRIGDTRIEFRFNGHDVLICQRSIDTTRLQHGIVDVGSLTAISAEYVPLNEALTQEQYGLARSRTDAAPSTNVSGAFGTKYVWDDVSECWLNPKGRSLGCAETAAKFCLPPT